jgi:DNA-binding MarR family transcriptional regulator
VLRLPEAAQRAYQQAYVDALTPVFAVAAGVALIGFGVSWMLEERPLSAAAATSRGLEDSLAAPKSADSLAELEQSIALHTTREERERFHGGVAERAGVALGPGATWALVRIDQYGFDRARAIAEQRGVPEARIEAVVAALQERGLVAGEASALRETAAGRALTDQVVAARREMLAELVADGGAERPEEVDHLLRRLSRELVGEQP